MEAALCSGLILGLYTAFAVGEYLIGAILICVVGAGIEIVVILPRKKILGHGSYSYSKIYRYALPLVFLMILLLYVTSSSLIEKSSILRFATKNPYWGFLFVGVVDNFLRYNQYKSNIKLKSI